MLDESLERTLLTLHRKGRFWVQFGGHLEVEDQSIAAAATREGREESGLEALELWRPDPVDLDRHALSAAFGRCREHLDIAFVAMAADTAASAVSAESDDVAWWPLDALPEGIVADLPVRLHRAARAVRGT